MNKRTSFSICIKLGALINPLIGFMLLAITTGILGHLCAAFIPILGGAALLNLIGYEIAFSIRTIFFLVCIFAILRGLFHYGEQSFNHYIAFKLLAIIRNKVFVVLRRLCPAKLEGKDKGNLISMITSDIELLEVFYAHTVSPIVIALFTSLFFSFFIGHFHPMLGFLAFLAYAIIGIIVPLITLRLGGKNGECFRKKAGEMSSFILDSLRGLNEILQYGAGAQRLSEIAAKTEQLSHAEHKMKIRQGISTALTNSVILIFDMVMLFASTLLYREGLLDFNGVIIPFIALLSSFGPVIALANLGSTLAQTLGAGNRILDLLEESPVVDDVIGYKELAFHGGMANKVTFSYGNDCVLKDFSLDIPLKSIIGIKGKSGSGKSTLLKLLMRFWEVEKGQISISHTYLRYINTTNLRNMESYLTQETHLFHVSIRDNLRIAKLDATNEEIETACKKASIHDFILGLPSGYDTQVGELGETLSGGERQRIGLARAFLQDAPLLLLDEPTSNLDSLNEALILKSIYAERQDKTVILVSHRQSTLRIADRICEIQ